MLNNQTITNLPVINPFPDAVVCFKKSMSFKFIDDSLVFTDKSCHRMFSS
jgi:hypothetical protein